MLVYQPEKRYSAAQLFNHPYVLSSSDDTPYKPINILDPTAAAPSSTTTASHEDTTATRDSNNEQTNLDTSISHSAKDIDRDRREHDQSGSHKIRSHSAPGGVSYTTRVYAEDNSSSTSNQNS